MKQYEKRFKENRATRAETETALALVKQLSEDNPYAIVMPRRNMLNRTYRLPSKGLPYAWKDTYDVLNHLPPMYTEGLASELENMYDDEFTFELMDDYARLGYDMPPRIDGLAWPGTLNILRVPNHVRTTNDFDADALAIGKRRR